MGFNFGPFPALSPNELHVWRVDLDRPSAGTDLSVEFLSPDERQRAARFLRETDRQRFIAGHAALRMILGQYLEVPPARVEMTVRAGGKPELAASPGLVPLRHNLSHSEGLGMVALALDREVGVDVERVRPIDDVENIVKRYFAPGEQAAWKALPDDERLAAFFRCWTRKEAYLKARGFGLSLGLDQFEVSFAPAEPAKLLWCNDARDAAADWQMYDLSPDGRYMAACVAEKGIERFSVHDWSWFPAPWPA